MAFAIAPTSDRNFLRHCDFDFFNSIDLKLTLTTDRCRRHSYARLLAASIFDGLRDFGPQGTFSGGVGLAQIPVIWSREGGPSAAFALHSL